MFSTRFAHDTMERAISTFAQALLAALGTDVAGVTKVDFTTALKVAAVAGVLSVLKALAARRTSTRSASFVVD